jgi:hypothetical protein
MRLRTSELQDTSPRKLESKGQISGHSEAPNSKIVKLKYRKVTLIADVANKAAKAPLENFHKTAAAKTSSTEVISKKHHVPGQIKHEYVRHHFQRHFATDSQRSNLSSPISASDPKKRI